MTSQGTTTYQAKQNMLKSFRIYTYDSGETYKAEVDFSGYAHEVKIELNPDLAQKILELCMDDIVNAIQDTTANALESMRIAAAKHAQPLIEDAVEAVTPTRPGEIPALDDTDEIPF